MMGFAIKVDYFSISFLNRRVVSPHATIKEHLEGVGEGDPIRKLTKYLYATRSFWQEGKGRKPYKHHIHDPKGGWSYFYSDTLPHSVLEFTGRGCDQLTAWESMIPLMRDFGHRCTRIDIAVDFLTDTTPKEFLSTYNKGRFKSDGHINTDSGLTEYVGSQKSGRYARVYKYLPPHPRSPYLRIEHVSREEWAKATCAAVVRDGVKAVAQSLGETFRWTSPLWDEVGVEGASEIQVPTNSRTPATDNWLLKQVLPAIQKLHEAGSDDVLVYFLNQAYNIINDKSEGL